jgi:RHH-type transcriptional regulator, proline utilization regulon repressor / proline dehydrogenase / delta 1-pyrroline-5-carboxylate dehydrogenase
MSGFRNEPVLELRRSAVRAELATALEELDPTLPLRVPVWIGDERRDGDELPSTDPGAPDRVVALAARATPGDADTAVRTAARAFPAWSARPAAERAAILVDAAARLRARRGVLAALEVRECAKPWPEADADVCEAIDFLEYYARGAVALEAGRPLVQVPGEHNELAYRPRGVTAVIAPWNFPIAIPAGMTAAALATGNAVVLKPAEQSPGCAYELVRALREAGVPPDALALLPGEGDVGQALVEHVDVHTIAFTGSAPVGLDILARAAQTPDAQRHLKRVIAEMGGKNCVIVDSDADLDDAVPAIVASAFKYAGQKCSAASRVLVHEAIADTLVERLAGAVDLLVVGQAEDFASDVPPVIERTAQERVLGYVARAAREGRLAAHRTDAVPDDGWFCPPTVAADLPADSAVLHEEIFGPVLAVESVRDVDEAMGRVEALRFALTGGLFARNPQTVERVAASTPVGNLYVNREITGAMVGRQPFGGNRLSGTGTKAGGPDYLLHFVEPHVVTENTVRHGLVV